MLNFIKKDVVFIVIKNATFYFQMQNYIALILITRQIEIDMKFYILSNKVRLIF